MMHSPEASSGNCVLSLHGVSAGYGVRTILHALSLGVHRGEMVALLGRNGAGKSTLIRLLSGVLTPGQGEVRLCGMPLAGRSRRQIARHIAVVPQELQIPFAFSVRELVAMGRTAHTPFLGGETVRDREIVERALAQLDLSSLAARAYNSLSGGERQRVVLAMALAQEPDILLLDEPTVHLDLSHQIAVLRVLRALNASQGLTVLAAIHDLNLAALLFDRLIMLHEGHVAADGPPTTVLTAPTIRTVYGAEVAIQTHPTADVPQVMLLP
jgi:iron complex transport system ATP-binding protein